MKNDSPVVSVVIPALDAAVTLLETLQSVSLQTYPNLDVIVVDDGSTDGTADLVRQYGISDPRVRLLQKPNSGVASARNEGIRAMPMIRGIPPRSRSRWPSCLPAERVA